MSAHAQTKGAVPLTLTVQGDLTDLNGDPVNGVQSFEIKVYMDGATVWRTLYRVGVNNGSFMIRLGDVGQGATPMNPNSTAYDDSAKLNTPNATQLSESMFFGTNSTTSVEIGVSVKADGKYEEIKRYGLGEIGRAHV